MIDFRKVVQSGTACVNPFENFESFKGEVEIRLEPFAGLKPRIFHFPGKKIKSFRFLSPLNAADTKYFDILLHYESACLLFPQDIAHGAQAAWNGASK